MGRKNKLQRFAENENFSHVFQPGFYDLREQGFEYKGHWHKVFGNNNPIVGEFGCGKGDYSVALARRFPDMNFTGVDIKGARIWRGAKTSEGEQMNNVAFLRTRIEFTPLCFDPGELSEIWITFPDPQLNRRKRIKKRLTSSRFLSYYQSILTDGGIIHLKTDDDDLYLYTLALIKQNNLPLLDNTDDVYLERPDDDILHIKTFYETKWLGQGKTIKYLKFRLPSNQPINELPGDEE